MTRRDLFASLTGALSALGLTPKVKALQASTVPIYFVVTFDKNMPCPNIDEVRKHVVASVPNCPPVIVCIPGMDVKGINCEGITFTVDDAFAYSKAMTANQVREV